MMEDWNYAQQLFLSGVLDQAPTDIFDNSHVYLGVFLQDSPKQTHVSSMPILLELTPPILKVQSSSLP